MSPWRLMAVPILKMRRFSCFYTAIITTRNGFVIYVNCRYIYFLIHWYNSFLCFLVCVHSSCVQAASTLAVKTPCVPLQYNSYCRKKEILLDHFVFATNTTQMENDNKLNRFESSLNFYLSLFGFSLSGKCRKAIDVVYCHHYFPRCDGTGNSYKAQRLCKETCQYFTNSCSQELSGAAVSRSIDIINCAKLSLRNSGESPECYYFDVRDNENGKSLTKNSSLAAEDVSYEGGGGLISKKNRDMLTFHQIFIELNKK